MAARLKAGYRKNASNGAFRPGSTKVFHSQAAAFNDALKRAYRKGLAAVVRHDHLATALMSPLLMAAFLANKGEALFSHYPGDIPGTADWKMRTQGRATSTTLAPTGRGSDDGSNHNARASFAL